MFEPIRLDLETLTPAINGSLAMIQREKKMTSDEGIDFFDDLLTPEQRKLPDGIIPAGARGRPVKLKDNVPMEIPEDTPSAEDLGLQIPEEIITELVDPEFFGMFHYSYRASRQGCKGPLCKRFAVDQQRYIRRISGIKRAIERQKPYIERPNRNKEGDRVEMTQIILALLMASGRILPHHLVSVCDRDGVEIPPGAAMYDEPRKDIVPEELMELYKTKVKQPADAKTALSEPLGVRNPPEEILPILAWITARSKKD